MISWVEQETFQQEKEEISPKAADWISYLAVATREKRRWGIR